MEVRRSLNGALAGTVAAAIWAAQQPLDKRLFRCRYDDLELLGKLATRDAGWPVAGLLLHLQNGAVFGAAYAQARPLLPGPPALRGACAGLAEHVALWPLGRLSARRHPARRELTPLTGNPRAFAQAAWRHLLFGAILGALEARLNAPVDGEERAVPVSSNGHGNIEMAASAA